jgi:hypothetical protein
MSLRGKHFSPSLSLCHFFMKANNKSLNCLAPNDFKRRRPMSPLKIKIPFKKSLLAALQGGI